MNNLIDKTYFVEPILIPNVNDTGYAADGLVANLNHLISLKQPLFLIELLGQTLYDQFASGMATVPIPAKWVALRNQLVDSTNKISPLANYVWYWWQRYHETVTTGMGDGKPTGQNITLAVNPQKVVDNWSDMASMLDIFDVWMQANISDYPDYIKSTNLYKLLNTYGF